MDAIPAGHISRSKHNQQKDVIVSITPKHPQRHWPHDEPNGWNLNAAKFLEMLQAQPLMWLFLTRAKYIELRIDTRDGGFNLYDRDKKPLSPDEVIKAIEEATAFAGGAPYRRTGS